MSGAVEGVVIDQIMRAVYDDHPMIVISEALATATGEPMGSDIPYDRFIAMGGSQLGLRRSIEVALNAFAALTTPPARSYADGVRQWFPHLCFAGEPMRKGQFREPWPMEEERTALAKAIFDGWYEGNEDWDSPHNDHLQMRAYFAADAAIRLLSQGGKA